MGYLDVRLQRLDTDVVDAEAFERELRIKGAVTFRRFCSSKLGGKYTNLWTKEENKIADLIHKLWKKNIKNHLDIQRTVLENFPSLKREVIRKVLEMMQE